jgi:hypothetical protein
MTKLEARISLDSFPEPKQNKWILLEGGCVARVKVFRVAFSYAVTKAEVMLGEHFEDNFLRIQVTMGRKKYWTYSKFLHATMEAAEKSGSVVVWVKAPF